LITRLLCSSIHVRWLSRCFLMPSSKSMIIWLRAEKQRLLCPLCEARFFAEKIELVIHLHRKHGWWWQLWLVCHLSQSLHRFENKIGSCISVMMVVTVDLIWRNREWTHAVAFATWTISECCFFVKSWCAPETRSAYLKECYMLRMIEASCR
jgi:hypothetical protein